MLFKYSATNKKDRRVEGLIEAKNSKEAKAKLTQKGVTVLTVAPVKKEKTKKIGQREISLGFITYLDKLLFVKHLSLMIGSGLNISEALRVLEQQSTNTKMRKIISEVLTQVETGKPLAESMARYPRVFPELAVNLVRVGEVSGNLEKNLKQLAVQLEKDYEIKKKVKGALVYPIFVLAITVGIGVALAVFVLPRLIPLFQSFKMDLPITTKMVLWIAEMVQNNGYWLAIAAGAIIVIIPVFLRTRAAKPGWHRLILHIPIAGKISRSFNLARFTRTLGLLLKSGVPILDAMKITASSLSNVVYRQEILSAREDVRHGQNLLEALGSREDLFPPVVSRMVGVGERSGQLDNTLVYLADFYETEVDNTTRGLASALEPVLLIVIGVVVGGVAVSVIAPIYQLTGQLSQ